VGSKRLVYRHSTYTFRVFTKFTTAGGPTHIQTVSLVIHPLQGILHDLRMVYVVHGVMALAISMIHVNMPISEYVTFKKTAASSQIVDSSTSARIIYLFYVG